MTTGSGPDPQIRPAPDEGPAEAGRKGGMAAALHPRGAVWTEAAAPAAAVVSDAGRTRAGWGAIWAGFFAGMMLYLLFSVLGMAIGFSIAAPADLANGALQGTGLGWFIGTAVVSFFFGGWVTGRSLAFPGKGAGAMNGFLYGSLTILALLAISALPVMQGLTAMLGMGIPQTAAAAISRPAATPAPAASVVSQKAAGAARTARTAPKVAAAAAKMAGAKTAPAKTAAAKTVAPAGTTMAVWWSWIGLVVALAAASLGGMFGARSDRQEMAAAGAPDVKRAA